MFTFRSKLIFAFITFGILLILVSTLLTFKMQELSLKATSIEKAAEAHQKLDNEIGRYIHEIKHALFAIENSFSFQQYLQDPEIYKDNVKNFFFSLASSSTKFMQFRYIDKEGLEKIRVDSKGLAEDTVVIHDDKLQDKFKRYYFQEAINHDYEVSYSRIDLNIEHGEIEKPIKPVIRVAKKVMHNNQLSGILIINIFIENFLDALVASPIFDIYLIDKNGYFLLHPEKEKRWSLYLQTGYTAEDEFGSDSACILNNIDCENERFYAKDVQNLHNPDGLKLIVQPRMYKIRLQMQEQFKNMLYISLAVLALSFPIAYLLSITPVRLKDQVDQLNATLEKKIEEKVIELKNSNKMLEQKVQERTQDLEEANVKLYKQATIDSLTHIPNRRYFFEMSDRYLQLSHRKSQPLSFIIFDIDFFKKVNDTYGHDTGDQVLKHIVDLIASLLRRSDIFGRIGGEEFALVLADTELEQAAELAEKLRKSVEEDTFKRDDLSIALTISLGVSEAEENDQEVSLILSRADVALYQAKERGRNRVVVQTSKQG